MENLTARVTVQAKCQSSSQESEFSLRVRVQTSVRVQGKSHFYLGARVKVKSQGQIQVEEFESLSTSTVRTQAVKSQFSRALELKTGVKFKPRFTGGESEFSQKPESKSRPTVQFTKFNHFNLIPIRRHSS